MTDPVYRTILLFDIEQFGSRDDVEQAYLRRVLYDVVDAVVAAAGVDEAARLRADRGDSVMELIETQASVPTLVKALLTEAPAQLRNKNRLLAESAQMRLRIVLSAGYVAVDELGGWVGSDLNHAVRLLNSDALRAALRQRDEDCVLGVSAAVYQGVVRHGPLGVAPEDFRSVTVPTKEGPTVAWVHGVTAAPEPTDEPARDTDETSRTDAQAAPSPAPTSSIGGNQYGVSGSNITGGVHLDFGGPGRGTQA